MNKIKKMPQIDQVSLQANLKIPVKMSGKIKWTLSVRREIGRNLY